MANIIRPETQFKYSRMRRIGPQTDLPVRAATMPIHPGASDSRFNPSIAIRQRIRNAQMTPTPPLAPAAPVMAEGYPITMVPYGASILVGGTPQLAIFQNNLRQRFVISNPDTAPGVLHFFFKNTPNNPISLIPAQTWDDDSGRTPIDEIWIVSATTGHVFSAYEGVPAPL